MMKLRSGNLVMLGLSERNIELLKQGKPIKFDGAEIKIPGLTFGIMYGETERAMEQALIDAGYRIPQ